MKKAIFLLAAGLFGTGAWASCYTVLGPKGELLSESRNPPVDMSYPLHQTVPARFGPGAVLVFGIADGDCGGRVDRFAAVAGPARASEPSPQGHPGMRPPRTDRE